MVKTFSRQNKLLVLLVDDNMGFVERMKTILDEINQIGYINVATDFNEAWMYVNDDRPDIVLLDINLPGRNGIEILRKIRVAGHACKVIMLTNHADEYYRQLCKDLGADYFLDKSNDFSKVSGIISNIGGEGRNVSLLT